LPPEIKQTYQSKIISTARNTLFLRQHTFIETARLSETSARFHFSPETQSPGPFYLKVEINPYNSRRVHAEKDDFKVDPRNPLVVRFPTSIPNYRIRLSLDNHVAYENEYFDQDIPF
jgi:hypothetical protein